jgi:hypothetical protein
MSIHLDTRILALVVLVLAVTSSVNTNSVFATEMKILAADPGVAPAAVAPGQEVVLTWMVSLYDLQDQGNETVRKVAATNVKKQEYVAEVQEVNEALEFGTAGITTGGPFHIEKTR